ncbi:MAG: hypothetical protein OXE43_07395 [Chloroflexi bacterium]|nr:hypothetical protein [Chloroflexota bacterium]
MPTAHHRVGRQLVAGRFEPPGPAINAVLKGVSTIATVNARTALAAA